MHNINIEVKSLKDGNIYRTPVSAYPDAVAGNALKIVEPDEKVVDLGEIHIIFDYPLTHSAEFSFTREGGFTKKTLYQAIYDVTSGFTRPNSTLGRFRDLPIGPARAEPLASMDTIWKI